MNTSTMVGTFVMLSSVILIGADAPAAEKFRKLTGTQIRTTLAGMEITDEVHWGDVYERNGTLTTHSMGRKTAANGGCRRTSSVTTEERT